MSALSKKRGAAMWDPKSENMVIVPSRKEVIADVLSMIWSRAVAAEMRGDTGAARTLYDLHGEIETNGVPE